MLKDGDRVHHVEALDGKRKCRQIRADEAVQRHRVARRINRLIGYIEARYVRHTGQPLSQRPRPQSSTSVRDQSTEPIKLRERGPDAEPMRIVRESRNEGTPRMDDRLQFASTFGRAHRSVQPDRIPASLRR